MSTRMHIYGLRELGMGRICVVISPGKDTLLLLSFVDWGQRIKLFMVICLRDKGLRWVSRDNPALEPIEDDELALRCCAVGRYRNLHSSL